MNLTLPASYVPPHALFDLVALDALQERVLGYLAGLPEFTRRWYFAGGTSLKALAIVPRVSEDLDFFTLPEARNTDIHGFLGRLKPELERVLAQEVFVSDRGFFVPGMKMDFCAESTAVMGGVLHAGELGISHPANTLAAKVSAVCSRDEVKDIIDIAFLVDFFGIQDISVLARLFEEKYRLVSALTEEKIALALFEKLQQFVIPPEIFLVDGEAHAARVRATLTQLIHTYHASLI